MNLSHSSLERKGMSKKEIEINANPRLKRFSSYTPQELKRALRIKRNLIAILDILCAILDIFIITYLYFDV